MNSEPKNSDVLQNLEFVVVNIWRKHREISDSAIARVYEAAFQHYRAEARGHQPKPCVLTGLERELSDGVTAMCEVRLGRRKMSADTEADIPAIPVSELVDCLRTLAKSVERHTRQGGRQGYLTFVDRFLP